MKHMVLIKLSSLNVEIKKQIGFVCVLFMEFTIIVKLKEIDKKDRIKSLFVEICERVDL